MRLRTMGAIAATLLLGGTAACGDDDPPAAPGAAAPAFADCAALAGDGARPVYFTDPTGTRLAGSLRGDGRTGITLGHMSDGDACSWDPYARRLAKDGYRVLVFHFQAHGESDGAAGDGDLADNVVGAAQLLRKEGSDKVVLMGASMGASASVAAGVQLQPPAAGVISVSGPTVYPGADAVSAAPKLTVPVLYLVGEIDGAFAANARELYAKTPATTPRELVVVPSSVHGIHLLGQQGETGEKVTRAMNDFLARHAPAG